MTSAYAESRRAVRLRFPWEAAAVAACGMAALVSAAMVVVLGMWALAVPLYAALIAGALIAPGKTAYVTLALMVAFEPAAIDISRPISTALYTMPPGLDKMMPLTMTPIEVLVSVLFVSVWLRPASKEARPRLPLLALMAPVVMLLGLAYGLTKGGVLEIAYQESRGLIMATLCFTIVRRLWTTNARGMTIATFAGTSLLSVIVLGRYMFITKDGGGGISPEFAYAHEDAVFLAIGFILGGLLLMRSPAGRTRILLLGYELMMLGALVTTGRRAGTLVLVVGALVSAWFVFKKRPALVLALGIPVMLVSAVYVGAYWNKEYGAIAQPARAIRSQIDPSARDESSDQYRAIEKYDVTQTIKLNRIFGVGLGKPFIQFQGLPGLTSFWPLQLYTSHTNVMWLWLKFGVLGISMLLGLWALTLSRCMRQFRLSLAQERLSVLPIAVAAVLVMYLSFAQVDLAFPGSRSAIPLGIAMAIGLSLPTGREKRSET